MIVIFICTEDPFNESLYRYTFRYIAAEKKDLLLSDGTTKIFLNTKGTKGEISPRLKELLDYLEKPVREPKVPILKRIEKERVKISTDQVRRLDYMKYEADMQDNYKEGKLEGKLEGEATIILKLLEAMTIEEVAKITDKTVEEIRTLT